MRAPLPHIRRDNDDDCEGLIIETVNLNIFPVDKIKDMNVFSSVFIRTTEATML